METHMSSGSSVRTHYAPQTTIETTPVSGWKTLPVITNGLTVNTTLTDSEILGAGRMKTAGMVTGGEIAGDISSELMFGTFDDLIAAAFWSDWQTDVLSVGSDRKFFAVAKDFEDINAYYLFKGVHVNTFSLEIGTDSLVSVNFGLMGLGFETSKTASLAKTPTAAVTGDKASGLSIGEIKSGGAPIGVCVESFSLEIDNQAEIQKCLGPNMYGGNVLAMLANITGSMTLAFSPKAYDLLEMQRTGTITSIEIPINFPGGKSYTINLPKIQISGDIPSPSPTDIVTAEVTFTVVDESPTITRVTGAA